MSFPQMGRFFVFVTVQLTAENAEIAEKKPEDEKLGRWEVAKLNLSTS